MLVVGRVINGFCVGICSAQVPVYISELAPPSKRGRLVGAQQWAITWGIMIMFYLSYGSSFAEGTAAFRIPWGLQMIPAIGLFGAMFFMPESPRWLARQGRWEEAHSVLALVHSKGDPDSPFVRRELEEIREMVEFEKNNSDVTYLELLKPRMINRTHIGVFTQIWSQLTGMNVMSRSFHRHEHQHPYLQPWANTKQNSVLHNLRLPHGRHLRLRQPPRLLHPIHHQRPPHHPRPPLHRPLGPPPHPPRRRHPNDDLPLRQRRHPRLLRALGRPRRRRPHPRRLLGRLRRPLQSRHRLLLPLRRFLRPHMGSRFLDLPPGTVPAARAWESRRFSNLCQLGLQFRAGVFRPPRFCQHQVADLFGVWGLLLFDAGAYVFLVPGDGGEDVGGGGGYF